ncbi:EAL domain-containing protein [Bosea caraganae]|uniref:EAL domain-containing protein n=1 Tax=Bosea caraganae TaxID=2763117 RepID=UPI0011C01F19|nr:EAL domain-containing protein [Bosea caraganae]
MLIIEDAPDDVELLLLTLRRAGLKPDYRVVDTVSGIEDALGNHAWDIVLADFNVPGTDFATILRLSKTADPDRPVIVVSGSIGEETAVELMRNGVADLILKSNMARLAPAIVRELTAARQELARREADQRFRNIVEVTGDWIWETDEAHRFTFFSEATERSSWLDAAGNLGKTRWELTDAEPDGDQDWRQHKADLAARRAFRNYRVCFGKDAGRHHLVSSGVPFFDRNGVWRGYRGITRDETPIIEAYRRAEEAETLLHDAVDSISEGFVVFDAEDRVVMVNEAYRSFHAEIADIIKPGATFEELLKAAIACGIYPDAVEHEAEWLAARMAEHRDLSGNSLRRLKDGRWMLVTERRMRNGGTAGLRMDITALKTAEAERDYLSYHDAITGLPNQALFTDRLAQALVQMHRSGVSVAVLSLELTSLADIRVSQGLEAGEAALHETGNRIQAALAAGDTVAHVGNGRYLAFSGESGCEAKLAATIARVLRSTEQGFEFNGADVPLRIAIGVSVAPSDGEEPDGLIRAATTALSGVKANPLRRYQFYRAEMTKAAVFRWNMEADLRRAIEKKEFLLHYQPQLDTRSYRVVGVEALLRWAHPEHGMISPGQFIPVAEETGLIVPLGEYALRLACTEARGWHDQLAVSVPVAVNLSAVQLAEAGLEDTVTAILRETGLPPSMLKLELTESAILSDAAAATRTMQRLAEGGIRFALDDFGMEHSSLSYLSRLPIDTLKVDYAFVSKMTEDRAHAALVQAIISMTHSLGMVAIAEGVERSDQLFYLQAYGCDALQGFLFSRPLPLAALLQVLAAGIVMPAAA